MLPSPASSSSRTVIDEVLASALTSALSPILDPLACLKGRWDGKEISVRKRKEVEVLINNIHNALENSPTASELQPLTTISHKFIADHIATKDQLRAVIDGIITEIIGITPDKLTASLEPPPTNLDYNAFAPIDFERASLWQ